MRKYMYAMFLSLICSISIAQTLIPGMYRYKKNQNEVKIKVLGDEVVLTAWQMSMQCSKVSKTKYYNAATTDFVELIDKDHIIIGNEKYASKDELGLYSPEIYTPLAGLTSFAWNGERYYAIAANQDKTLVGEYLYLDNGNWGEPKVSLLSNKEGSFQRHMVAPDAISWWGIETNYKGQIQKLTGEETGNYKMMLVVKYLNSGEFDRMQVIVFPGEKKTVIMGERVFKW